jgi:hypothetical protein
VQRRHDRRLISLKALAQEIGEQAMVPIPPACIIQRYKEEIGLFQLLQDRLAILASRQGITKGSGEPLEHGCLEKKTLNALRLSLEDLFHEIVENMAVAASKVVYKIRDILSALQRYRGHLQTRDPAFCVGRESGNGISGELQARLMPEKAASFFFGKTQLGGPQLYQLAPAPETRQGKRRVRASGDNQVHIGGQVIEEKADRAVNLLAADDVVVIQHEEKRLGKLRYLVDERYHHRLEGRWLWSLKEAQKTCPKVRSNRLKCGHEVGEKPDHIIVAAVEGNPAHSCLGVGEPFSEQSGLAESRGCGDENEFPVYSVVEQGI